MTKPIVSSIIIYIVQLVNIMICTSILIEKVLCMCLVGLIVNLYYYNMCVCWGCLGCTYRETRMNQNIYCNLY